LSIYFTILKISKSFTFKLRMRNPVIATTESAGSRPVIPKDGDRRFRTMATTRRSEATLVY
jgi:hypothetical protein